MNLTILKYPDPLLKKVSSPVENFDSKLHELLDEMARSMYQSNGIGLAAPQVGHFVRAFIIDVGASEEKEQKLYEFINPKLRDGAGKIAYEEGCLSLPGINEYVNRKESIFIDYQDRMGAPHTLHFQGLLSVAVQHENDHLDGILFIDRLSPLKKRLVKRKIAKMDF